MDVHLDGLVTLYTPWPPEALRIFLARAVAKLPLSETLKDLTVELWSQFVLTYTPANQTRDGKERKLRIDVADTLDDMQLFAEGILLINCLTTSGGPEAQ